MEEVWFKGSIEQAFLKAQREDKLVFLYWGAVWCPPCNELKDQVFSKPEFKEMMLPFVPVYLDGDTERAQVWADKFKAYGYPTVLILDHKKAEKYRLNGSINLAEFSKAIQYAHTSHLSLDELLSKVNKHQLSAEEWRALAYISWGQLPQNQYPDIEVWKLQDQLIRKIPVNYATVRSILTAEFLVLSLRLKDNSTVGNKISALKDRADELLGYIFADSQSMIAVRQYLNLESADILGFFYPQRKTGYDRWKQTWLQSADTIARNATLSVDTRLWTVYPTLALHKLEHGERTDFPEDIRQKVIASVKLADQRAQSPYERHSVISGAAYLLGQVKAYKEAQNLLEKELKTTNTPWYYQSSLSSLAQEQGDTAAALMWSEAARKSATGRATKLQWITNDLILNTKLDSPNQGQRIFELTKEFYDLALALSDGFSGRNQFRAQRVAKSLKPFLKVARIKRTVEVYRTKCLDSQDVDQNCKKHFGDLL